MEAALDFVGYAYALGRAEAAWQFAGVALRRAVAFATISAAWDIFRRDAGAGNVGPAHDATTAGAQLLFTEDPRRDTVLLWLADHGAPAISEAAAAVARMVGATRRFGAEQLTLLDAARDALASPITLGPIGRMIAGTVGWDDPAIVPLQAIAAAVDRLRRDPGFLEGDGAAVTHALPGGTLNRYVPAEPGSCWALNLALLAKGALPAGVPAPPGMVSRALFRGDLEPEDISGRLVEDARAAWNNVHARLLRLEPELARGRDALAHLSRNARTRDAWLLAAGLGACKRTQLARALGLSRAGADIQARALAGAGLVELSRGGLITLVRPAPARHRAETLDHGPLSNAVSELDESLAAIDRLLARPAQ